MALNIPMPKRGADIFDETFTSLNDILDKARQASLERGKFQEMQRHNGADIGLRKEAGARAGASAAREAALQPLRMELLKAQMEKAKKGNKSFTEKLDELSNYFGAGQEGNAETKNPAMNEQQQNPMEQGQVPQGKGPMSNPPMEEEEEEEQEGGIIPPETHEKMTNMMNSPKFKKMAENPMMRGFLGGMMKKEFGFNPFDANAIKEPPEMKRAAELKDKIALEKFKHEEKLADEQHKIDLKNDETKQKTIEASRKDIPMLEESLHSLDVMEKIAKNNPDLFGHWIIGNDLAARWSDNPNAGTWQAEGVQPIVDTEMKLSAKGNIPALKFAIANKPNFAETQQVAMAKIKANKARIIRALSRSVEATGDRLVIDPKGKIHISTAEMAKDIPKGWKLG
jgi:hypothetical protein